MTNKSVYYPALSSNAMLVKFQEMNATRNGHSFFGKEMGNGRNQPTAAGSPAEAMTRAFRNAGLTVPEHNFFGTPISEFVESRQSSTPAQPPKRTFKMPKRSRRELPNAA